MFQLSMLGSAVPGLSKGPGQVVTGDPAGLEGLLQGVDGAMAGFSGELQAILMQLSPQLIARLDELVNGGMGLPQAAKSLLAEAGIDGSGELFSQFLKQGLEMANGGGVAEGVRAALEGEGAPGPLAGRPLAHADNPVEYARSLTLPPAVGAMQGVAPAQAGATLQPQLAANLLDMGVPQQVGAKGWDAAIADRVMWMVQGEQQAAKLKLNPPNLGPIEVRVSINQDQTSVSFLAHHAAVREALEAALPRLREMFEQQSMTLVRADVSDPGAQQGGRAGDSAGNGGSSRAGHWGGEVEEGLEAADTTIVRGAADSLVDLFA